nr:MAG TPA: hypothetical protein [Bacteriophage sp.]
MIVIECHNLILLKIYNVVTCHISNVTFIIMCQ